jgi:hypothetical protein
MVASTSYAASTAARPSRSAPPLAWRSPKAKPVDLLFRSVAAKLRAHVQGRDTLAHDYADDDQLELLQVIHRAASVPAQTNVVGWANELVGVVVAQWVSTLRPSIFGQLAADALALEFTDGGELRVPGRTASPMVNAAFVGEGQPVPVRKVGLNSVPLPIKKLAVIVPFTREQAQSSAIEAIARAEITADTSIAVDQVLLDDQPADSVRPSGLRFGVSATTPAAAGPLAMQTDVRALLAAIQPCSRPALVVNTVQAASLRAVYPNEAFAVFASGNVAVGTVIALDLDAFVSASALPVFSVSEEAVIHEDDTPLAIVGGNGTAVIGDVASPVRNFFQTAVIGLKLEWPVDWAVRRSGAVAWVEDCEW